MLIELFSKKGLEQINWHDFRNGEEVKGYFFEMMKVEPKVYVKNVDAEIYLLAVDDLLIPITKTIQNENNSYVVSPFVHYVSYAIEELRELQNPLLEWFLKRFLQCFGFLMKWGKVDRVVTVNNWLLSTNLYEELTTEQAGRIVKFVQKQFPHDAILFRSLTEPLHQSIMEAFADQGCVYVPSRSIYLFYPDQYDQFSKKQRKTIRRDQQFMAKSGYIIEDKISSTDMQRVLDLYNELYLKKYSYFNPQFTIEFLQNAYENKLIHFRVLKKENQIDGVVGFIVRNGKITTPILGYDTSKPKKVGLYRLCSLILTISSLETGILFHRSAGAGEFKKNRGSQNEIEYSAVFTDHLPWSRRWIWRALEFLLTKIGVPLLKKFNL